MVFIGDQEHQQYFAHQQQQQQQQSGNQQHYGQQQGSFQNMSTFGAFASHRRQSVKEFMMSGLDNEYLMDLSESPRGVFDFDSLSFNTESVPGHGHQERQKRKSITETILEDLNMLDDSIPYFNLGLDNMLPMDPPHMMQNNHQQQHQVPPPPPPLQVIGGGNNTFRSVKKENIPDGMMPMMKKDSLKKTKVPAPKVISDIKSNRARPAKAVITVASGQAPKKEDRIKGAIYKIGQERKKWDGRQWRRCCIVQDCCSAARGSTAYCIIHGRGEVTVLSNGIQVVSESPKNETNKQKRKNDNVASDDRKLNKIIKTMEQSCISEVPPMNINF